MTSTFTDLQAKAKTGWEALVKGEPPRILVGTATCGRAAGGPQVVEALGEALSHAGIEAEVHQVGCIGLCYAEVLVDIIKPGRPRISYGNVTPDTARQLVEDYLVKDDPRPDLALGTLGEGA
ncbi:MAG: (2Fe-2S) ferredoxin domain-containing protein, partial [Dehalococcoidia bacterium]